MDMTGRTAFLATVLLILIAGSLTIAILLLRKENILVLVVSFDGFRYDYFKKNATPTLQKLRSEGVHAEYIRNVFPTKTFPNHQSIATGLFPESHGVLGNSVFDPKTNRVINSGEELWNFRNHVIPLWTLNEQNNHHSGVFMWPGCEYKYQGILPTFHIPYNHSMNWHSRVDILINWFQDKNSPINLAFIYFDEPDFTSHKFSSDTPQVLEQLRNVDNITNYLLESLNHAGLQDVNLFLLSDHGMDSVKPSNIINIQNHINGTKYNLVGASPVFHLIPSPDDYDEVFTKLKNASNHENFTIYTKTEMLDRWHFKNNIRTPPLLLVADEGFAFEDVQWVPEYWKDHGIPVTENMSFGEHGYDNLTTMLPFFIAKGPLLKKHYQVEPFDSVDLYSLFCEILSLPPPKTNGSLSNVLNMLIDRRGHSIALPLTGIVTIFTLFIGLGFGTYIYLDEKCRKDNLVDGYRLMESRTEEDFAMTLSEQHCLLDDIDD